MDILNLVLVAVAVSIDGFWGGFAFGMRKIKIPFVSLLIIASWSVICCGATMLLGSYLRHIIPIEYAKYIGGALLGLLGIFVLKDGYERKKETSLNHEEEEKITLSMKNLIKVIRNPLLADMDKQNDIKPMEGTVLGIAVAMDASIAAFTLALMGFNPFTTPFLFGLTHFALIGLGNVAARNRVINLIGEKFALLPGIIILALALMRFV